jgi:hypothetical protein
MANFIIGAKSGDTFVVCGLFVSGLVVGVVELIRIKDARTEGCDE